LRLKYKQNQKLPDEYIVSHELVLSPEVLRLKHQQNLPLSGKKYSRRDDEEEGEEEDEDASSSKKEKGYNYLETLRLQSNEISREIVKLQNEKEKLVKLPKSTTDPISKFTTIHKDVSVKISDINSRIKKLNDLKNDIKIEITYLSSKGGSKRSKTRKHKRRKQQTKKTPKKKRTVNKRRKNKKRRTNKH
jgi:chromosome segregation ATPase